MQVGKRDQQSVEVYKKKLSSVQKHAPKYSFHKLKLSLHTPDVYITGGLTKSQREINLQTNEWKYQQISSCFFSDPFVTARAVYLIVISGGNKKLL